ncbi:MAG: site-specific DNA-methyltransferase [Rickettsiales bacterium]|nr:site-specific DNA-methyltransferase [Rickettsiales bacterium]
MIIDKFKDKVFTILKTDYRIWNKEKNELNQTLLIDLLDKIDEKIIGILLENEEIRGKFFVKIKDTKGDIFVFKTNDFKFFLEENKINNSYTKYKNQIGLTDGKRFLKDSGDVVLDFPFKDCVLEGGQSTEEGEDKYFEYSDKAQKYEEKTAKRKEIFFNSVLAQDEIDRLFDEKALTGFKRFNKDGESEVKEIKRDTNGTIKENLIIKGNNLLALRSLKSQFTGKIKLIYIDPPYNTGNDGFKYNDNFNHSSWLTFMKNRLEVAKDLLRDDGVIFVQCDDNEQAYLKVLMDEVFKKDKFIGMFMWMKTSTPPSLSKNIRKKLEYIICYTKNNIENLNGGVVSGGDMPLLNNGNKVAALIFPPNTVKFNLKDGKYLKHIADRVEILEDFEVINSFNKDRLVIKGPFKWIQKTLDEEIKNKTFFIVKSEKFAIRYERQGERIKTPSNLISKTECNVGTNEDAKKELSLLFDDYVFDYPKPESLISYLIETNTYKEDIVLDFHLGSGTTAAVAHKMNRQYIGIEQMNYVETIAVERLKKVIDGEQTGISKSVNWQGGGDFIYFELAKYNQTARELIMGCEAKQQLWGLFDELYDKYFLNYNLKIKEFKEKVLKEDEFKNLELDDQKKMFLTMLDLNQMYVNKSEMADKNFTISQQDQELTKEFYKKD